jgi:hypothetical protein
MKRLLAAVIISGLAMPMASAGAESPAAPSADQVPPNDKIKIDYVPPTKAELIPLYERLKARKVLESVQQFLSPLTLPSDIEIRFAQCDSASLLYTRGGPATVCYEYVEQIERMAPKIETVELAQGTVTREQAITGPVVQAVLHQAALAAFDVLNVPVWGRRDDAADRVAAYVMLQFGENVAWSTIVGSAWFLAGSASAPPDFADVRGMVAQRYYTMLCMAVGSQLQASYEDQQYELFGSFYNTQAAGSLPARRVGDCRNEYRTLELGFNETIASHVDPRLLELVRSRSVNWIGFQSGE